MKKKRDHSTFLLPAQPVDLWDCHTVPPSPDLKASASRPPLPQKDCFPVCVV